MTIQQNSSIKRPIYVSDLNFYILHCIVTMRRICCQSQLSELFVVGLVTRVRSVVCRVLRFVGLNGTFRIKLSFEPTALKLYVTASTKQCYVFGMIRVYLLKITAFISYWINPSSSLLAKFFI